MRYLVTMVRRWTEQASVVLDEAHQDDAKERARDLASANRAIWKPVDYGQDIAVTALPEWSKAEVGPCP